MPDHSGINRAFDGLVTYCYNTTQSLSQLTHGQVVWFAQQMLAMFHQWMGKLIGYVSVLRNWSGPLTLPRVYVVLCGLCIFLTLLILMKVTLRTARLLQRTDLYPPKDAVLDYFDVFDMAKTAYEKGHTESVMCQIQNRSLDVNVCVPSNGLSLFMCACLSGQRRLIQYMLEKGGDPKRATSEGDSPLYLATYGILSSPQPDFYAIDLLVKAGCKVNEANSRGYTPLHRAASKGHLPLVKYLLSKGADPYKCNQSGIYPIDSAVNAGHIEVAEALQIEVTNPHVWDLIEPHTPLHISLGLMSPRRRSMAESPLPKPKAGFTR